jgi:hypothetical protein
MSSERCPALDHSVGVDLQLVGQRVDDLWRAASADLEPHDLAEAASLKLRLDLVE